MMEQPDDLHERCRATHRSPTANGDVVVLCNLAAGHDGEHDGRAGVFPVRWADEPGGQHRAR